MIEQAIIWTFLLMMPYRFEVTTTEADLARARAEIRKEMILVEKRTRAYRQRKSGRGL